MNRLFDYSKWTTGDCTDCGKRRSLTWRRCLTCRHPADQRVMIEAGIPCSTTGMLANLMRKLKGKTAAQAEAMLSFVHPIIMENLKVGRGWMLVPKSNKYEWIRRNGWSPVAKVERKVVERT